MPPTARIWINGSTVKQLQGKTIRYHRATGGYLPSARVLLKEPGSMSAALTPMALMELTGKSDTTCRPLRGSFLSRRGNIFSYTQRPGANERIARLQPKTIVLQASPCRLPCVTPLSVLD